MVRQHKHAFVVALISLALLSLQPSTIRAIDDEWFDLSIIATNCEQMPTDFPFQGGGCVPATGAVIVVTSLHGSLVGTCITDVEAPGSVVSSCTVPVRYGDQVLVTEDPATIQSEFTPTNNPQTFEAPILPPDGPFGGPVFINLPATGASEQPFEQLPSDASEVALVGETEWWIVPRAPGWGNTDEGDLYFGATVTNPTSVTVEIGVSWRAFEADGTPFPGCQMPGGDGPGVTTTLATGETAFLRCSRTRVPNTLAGLQVTSQLWVGEAIQSAPATVEVVELELVPLPDLSSPMETTYNVSALTQVKSGANTDVKLLFRFYDSAGVQVGTCESDRLVVELEIAQRTHCTFPLMLDTHGPQPVSVRAEQAPN